MCSPSAAPASAPARPVALIQFFADDGKRINTQVITREALARLPVVVHAFFLAVEKGQDAALVFLKGVTVLEGQNDAR